MGFTRGALTLGKCLDLPNIGVNGNFTKFFKVTESLAPYFLLAMTSSLGLGYLAGKKD